MTTFADLRALDHAAHCEGIAVEALSKAAGAAHRYCAEATARTFETAAARRATAYIQVLIDFIDGSRDVVESRDAAKRLFDRIETHLEDAGLPVPLRGRVLDGLPFE